MKTLHILGFAALGLVMLPFTAALGGDEDLVPLQLPKTQRDNLLKFLKDHSTPERYLPKDAKISDAQPTESEAKVVGTKDKPIKQYTVQITSHRPVPDEPDVRKVDVYYYRPNPEKGKPGITVKHTVDLTTGKQIGETEVMVKQHTPFSREEMREAVAMAAEKSEGIKALYKDRDPKDVRYEYLQLLVSKKSEQLAPGDRAVRLVFTANPIEGQPAPTPVRVIVNLTKELVLKDDR